MKTMDSLYNGRYFAASEDSETLNMSSLGPIYPMRVIDSRDERAIKTAQAFLDRYKGRIVGHGGSEGGFPWSAGVLATIFALHGQGDTAWRIIESTRPAICTFGGMTEVIADGEWNMQYFGTAQGAVCTAIHNLLLQGKDQQIAIFPAVPSAWRAARFDSLLINGVTVSATLDNSSVACTIKNDSEVTLSRVIMSGAHRTELTLEPGETRELGWTP
jgi:hypothetical protein